MGIISAFCFGREFIALVLLSAQSWRFWPVMRSFDCFYAVCLVMLLNKESNHRWKKNLYAHVTSRWCVTNQRTTQALCVYNDKLTLRSLKLHFEFYQLCTPTIYILYDVFPSFYKYTRHIKIGTALPIHNINNTKTHVERNLSLIILPQFYSDSLAYIKTKFDHWFTILLILCWMVYV